jgi:uncharacterized protein (TIGR03083 family)
MPRPYDCFHKKGETTMENETNNANPNEYTHMPRDKAELIERIQREWSALEQIIAQVDKEQMNRPDAGGWSVKDNLAHLTVWEDFMRLYHLQNRPPHEVLQLDKQMFEQLDEDGLNRVLHQRYQNRSIDDVLTDLRRSHAQVLTDLEQLSYNDLMKPHYPDDPEARPLIGWVTGNTYEHYQEHRATIQKFIKPTK